MPNYVFYTDHLETIDADEHATSRKIIETMTDGSSTTREKYGKSVRISHAKAHALRGHHDAGLRLRHRQDLHHQRPEILPPGVQAQRRDRAQALRRRERRRLHPLPRHQYSEKLDFYSHQKKYPMAEAYYSQTPFRYGNFVAKLGFVPGTPGLAELEKLPFDPQTPDALREETVAFFKSHAAGFDVVVHLNTDLDKMPIEDPMVEWSEEESPYLTVGRIVIPVQDAFDPARADIVDDNFPSPRRTPSLPTVPWAASTGCVWPPARPWRRYAASKTTVPPPNPRASTRSPRKFGRRRDATASCGLDCGGLTPLSLPAA